MAVAFKADSDFSKVIKDYETLQRQNVALKEKMAGITKEVKTQGSGLKATFEGGVGQLKSMVGGYFSLQAAISLVNAGLQEQKRISQEIHRVQMTAADAQAEVVKNLGGVSTEQATKFLKEIETIAQKGGAPSVAPVYEAAAQTLSAVGDETLTKSIMRETLPFFKSKMTELPAVAGAVGDLANISGAKTDEEIRRIVALILSSQKFSRGATVESFANVAPAIAAVAAVDTSGNKIRAERQGLALTSAISSAIADPEMALTKTATSEVATALAELLPEKDVLDAEGKLKRKGTGMTDLMTRLAAVQADPALQRRLFETGEGMQAATFRGPIKPVIQSLVSDPNSPIAKSLRNAMEGISDDPALVDQMRANLLGATPQLALSESTKQASSAIEQLQLGSQFGSHAFARKQVEEGLAFTGDFVDSMIGNRLSAGVFESKVGLGQDPLSAAEDVLKARRGGLLFPLGLTDILTGSDEDVYANRVRAGKDRPFADAATKELNELNRQQVQALNRLIEILVQQRTNVGATAAAAGSLRNDREAR